MRFAVLMLCLLAAPSAAFAGDLPEQHLILRNHAFVPQELVVPAGQKFKLIVDNEDNIAAEFESYELGREKVIPANGQISVFIDALDVGSYVIFDDFHHDTTTGKITAR